MKLFRLFFLSIISLSIQADTEQPKSHNETNPEIDRIYRRYQEQQAANKQFKSNISENDEQENIKNNSAEKRFTLEFTKILLAAAPKALKDKLLLLQSPNCPDDKKPKLLLLYGPSGSGKTTLAELIAQLTQRKYIHIKAANLGNELINSAQSNFKKTIEPYLDKPCIIGLDEIDNVIKEASSSHDPERKLPQQFWSLIDELARNPNVLIIGTTNDISNLPSQIKTRFSDTLIEIPDPKPETKKEILSYYVNQHPNECDDKFLNNLSNKCKELSVREIEKAVGEAWVKAFLRNPSFVFISKKDMEDTVKALKATVKKLSEKKKAEPSPRPLSNLEKAGIASGIAAGTAITANKLDKIAQRHGGWKKFTEEKVIPAAKFIASFLSR